ncbi:MAG: hypothetical protein GY822_02000 [Deltaproteobacteria bacterium]|nr:hypothetical protein [Deltaproteobacteria bacterium]
MHSSQSEIGLARGAPNLYSTTPDAFDTEERRLLQVLATDISFGLDGLRNRIILLETERRYRALFNALHQGVFGQRQL